MLWGMVEITPQSLLFFGALTAILGSAVGAIFTAWLTHGFQKKLLDQQLEFQRSQGEADAEQRAAIAKALNEQIYDLRQVIHFKQTVPRQIPPPVRMGGGL